MAGLEDLTAGIRVTSFTASGTATVESAQWIGEQGVKVIFRDSDGHLGDRFVYREYEPSLELVEMGRSWRNDGLSKTSAPVVQTPPSSRRLPSFSAPRRALWSRGSRRASHA